MKTNYLFLLLAFVLTPLFVNAQFCTPEEEEVWDFVQKSFEVVINKNIDAYAEMLDEDYYGWNNENPYTLSKEASLKRIKMFSAIPDIKTQFEIIPEKIIVKGNSAAAYYYYAMESTFGEGKWQSKGRYADFLIKEKGKWKYLAGMNVVEKEGMTE